MSIFVDGDPAKGQRELVAYGAATAGANPQQMLNFTVLQQLDRPNRYVLLEVWNTQTDYDSWNSRSATANFDARLTPLLGSPVDYRLNSLCGENYVDNTGCTQ